MPSSFSEETLIYIDVSETFTNGHQTGIQKTVMSVSKEICVLAEAYGLKLFFYIDNPKIGSPFIFDDPNDLGSKLQKKPARQLPIKISAKLRKKIFLLLDPLPGALNFAGLIYWTFFETRNRSKAEYMPAAPDYFLLLDSFWSRGHGPKKRIQYFQNKGTKVGLYLYDIIAITHPQFMTRRLSGIFSKQLFSLLPVCSDIFFSSEYSMDQSRHVLGKKITGKNLSVIPLGSSGQKRDDREKAVVTNKIVSIGTIEPRKNFEQIVNWWKKYGRNNFSLTIIGRPGWKTRKLQAELDSLSVSNSNFRWLKDCNEEELELELRSHNIGLQASFEEGFGLPILEMQEKGLQLVLSDIPVFREVAKNNAVFFEVGDSSSLNNALLTALNVKDRGASAVRNWREVADELLQKIENRLRN